tara:strand:+ start:2479 stop:2829 length:351 start_codon:yes stop_codon:yes gene_type:complete
MARAGAFSANFDPNTLDTFRQRCQEKGEKYTKVLERLAVLWLETDGGVFAGVSVPAPASNADTTARTNADNDLLKRLERLEEADEYNEETFSSLFQRLEVLEQKAKVGKYDRSKSN